MDANTLRRFLESIACGQVSVDEAVDRLKRLPFENLTYAQVDHHRPLRKGFPEVIFGEGKSSHQILGIMKAMVKEGDTVMVTRLSAEKAKEVASHFPEATYHHKARVLVHSSRPIKPAGKGLVMVISAGTSDIPVAEEAAVTATTMGHRTETLYDVGVSGIHRLVGHKGLWSGASVFVVVAGMEGALPSVVGGLVDKPVIAVPTSIGYGASFGGMTALLAMLNSCASNVSVVNIDNGFGAGYIAALINALANG
ncbi:MAG: nickel pincer cofactor biosynthesis protein LarB [Thermodesulfobacteriota bacterium]|nr:nickel pincer cofactor biosynthesis protein LarB [Thermodesulfobacteriota bacterium]